MVVRNKFGQLLHPIICPDCGKTRYLLKGQINRQKTLFCYSCSRNKLGRPNFKSGTFYRSGYKFILSPEHPLKNNLGYVREHRLVMEKHLGRYLKRNEIVHHINSIRDDNRIENLVLITSQKDHMQYHPKSGKKCSICGDPHLARGFCNKHYWVHFLKEHRRKTLIN